jgi:predicted ATPase
MPEPAILSRAFCSCAEALAAAQSSGERCWEAELYRRQGEMLLKRRDGRADAGVAFRHALAVARYQGARAIERRAAARLARPDHGLGDSRRSARGMTE